MCQFLFCAFHSSILNAKYQTKSLNKPIIVNINIYLFDLLKCTIWLRSFAPHFYTIHRITFLLRIGRTTKTGITYWPLDDGKWNGTFVCLSLWLRVNSNYLNANLNEIHIYEHTILQINIPYVAPNLLFEISWRVLEN